MSTLTQKESLANEYTNSREALQNFAIAVSALPSNKWIFSIIVAVVSLMEGGMQLLFRWSTRRLPTPDLGEGLFSSSIPRLPFQQQLSSNRLSSAAQSWRNCSPAAGHYVCNGSLVMWETLVMREPVPWRKAAPNPTSRRFH
ncbi:hypothetical protein CDAR_273951 [Caerostris darwini]|uniref:Uncharacterized protein n=1 Tax=Caerostris darwini TaxID=1538125 RepID=A0AAV4RGL1_9ARAC|nr:hypothetical protein CDAR_273951 [Caerostris darwini]